MTMLEFFANNPKRWTKECLYRGINGVPIYPGRCGKTEDDIQSACIVGAALLCYGDKYGYVIDKLSALLPSEFKLYGLAAWNNSSYRTFQDIVDLCRRGGV